MKIVTIEVPYFPAAPGLQAVVMAVLGTDAQGKYRAYIAIVPSDDPQWAEWVAKHGRKLTHAEAVPRYFVGVTAEDYAA